MPYPETFTGFQAPNADEWTKFAMRSWNPRPPEDLDVDVKLECCSVCSSDMHTINGEVGDLPIHLPYGFIATEMTFDLIINTVNSSDGFELNKYLSLLDVHGRWNLVGLPGGSGMTLANQNFVRNVCYMGTTRLGSHKEMLEMFST
ncbi:hypothetical protein AbraIFM66951_004500 [Aspergillus brasiliensis]|uniref:Uncharacterized protein n=1 Tax=Aspergillus brasiliensis TaxID=319629 RepID=A0A9W5YKH6_9EURO|nr:hypothetical protein AbraCBS73388_003302 [Aspergillus brasiliensis]GKZ43401.1 hypothetical protein AbraIFM66951_004500 [Aspergillus brasiliensis]